MIAWMFVLLARNIFDASHKLFYGDVSQEHDPRSYRRHHVATKLLHACHICSRITSSTGTVYVLGSLQSGIKMSATC